MNDTSPASDRIAASVHSLVGLPARNAAIGVGSFITVDFGGTRQTSVGDLLGEFHLWVYGSAWSLSQDSVVRATCDDERSVMQSAVLVLEGSRVTSVTFRADAVQLCLEFDGSVLLTVAPSDDPDMEHWMLFLPDGFVIVAGPGDKVRLARADEPDP